MCYISVIAYYKDCYVVKQIVKEREKCTEPGRFQRYLCARWLEITDHRERARKGHSSSHPLRQRAPSPFPSARVLRAGCWIVGDDGGRGAALSFIWVFSTAVEPSTTPFLSVETYPEAMGNEASMEGEGQAGQPGAAVPAAGAPASISAPPDAGQLIKPSNGAPAGGSGAGPGPGINR